MFDPAPDEDPAPSDTEDDPLRCAVCDLPVAHRHDRQGIDGPAARTFFNPSGILMAVTTFRRAHTAHDGPATTEFTWFPGYAWRIASCPRCGVQLGWRFEGDTTFWALLDRAISG